MVPMRLARKVARTSSSPIDVLDDVRLEQADQGVADVLDGAVDDPVGADVHALALGEALGLGPRADVEADDDRLRGRRQHDVGLVDGADARVDDPQAHLGLLDLLEGVHQGADRALDVALDDDVELLQAALADAREDVVQRDRAGGSRAPRRAGAGCARPARWRASRSFSTARKRSPASTTPPRPSTSTGTDGAGLRRAGSPGVVGSSRGRGRRRRRPRSRRPRGACRAGSAASPPGRGPGRGATR